MRHSILNPIQKYVENPNQATFFIIFAGSNENMTPEQRHKNMSAIRSRDTRPELQVRRFLWHRGYRYRLNHKRLPGKPDVVLTKYRTCIFINGCFWHGHLAQLTDPVQSSACCKIPATRQDFWVNKFRRNRERDERVQHELARMGWHCITIWECQLKGAQQKQTLESLDYTLNVIYLKDRRGKGYTVEESEVLKAAEEPF